MTEQEWEDLGRRAVACNGWRWMPGMLTLPIDMGVDHCRIRLHQADPNMPGWSDFPVDYNGSGMSPTDGGIPDLRDPATLGCLMALVREAWGGGAYVQQAGRLCAKPWRVWIPGEPVGYGRCEAEAMVAALEEAQ